MGWSRGASRTYERGRRDGRSTRRRRRRQALSEISLFIFHFARSREALDHVVVALVHVLLPAVLQDELVGILRDELADRHQVHVQRDHPLVAHKLQVVDGVAHFRSASE
eukprot:750332-Hanusia_phi.AAC.1